MVVENRNYGLWRCNLILKYNYKNYRSFKNDVEFSLLAPSNKVKNRFPNNFVKYNNGYDVLKTIAIVGENAGGKTNFVRSLNYFKDIVLSNEPVRSYKAEINSCVAQSNYPDGCDTRQTFEIVVIDEKKTIYKYNLAFDYYGVVKEELATKTDKKSEFDQVFNVERTKLNSYDKETTAEYSISSGLDGKEMKRILDSVSKGENRPGCFVNVFSILAEPYSVSFLKWLREKLSVERAIVNYNIIKSMSNEEEDKEIMNDPKFFEIFKMIDYSISQIIINDEDPYKKTVVVRTSENGTKYQRELKDDSSGVNEFFPLAIELYKVVYLNKTVIVDEMDRVLNPVLSDRIVSYINGTDHEGQFVFTTHNALHLNLKNYMKEQIYFVTKSIETLESEMYSLSDFPEVRYETTKIYEFYMKGILGGTASE